MNAWYETMENLEIAEQPYVSDSDDLYGFEDLDFRSGKFIHNWPSAACVKCTDPMADGPPDDVLRNHIGVPIFSSRLQQAIQLWEITGLQFLPLHVLRSDGDEITGYAIANVLDLCPALDTERSRFDVFAPDYFLETRRGQISAVQKVVLAGKRLTGKDIVRLQEFPVSCFVSTKFVHAYQTSNCTGWAFHEVEVV